MKVIIAVAFAILVAVESLPNPQRQGGGGGFLGVLNQWFSGLSDAVNSTSDGFFSGTATGVQAIGNGFQNLANGIVSGFNGTAGGIIDGVEAVVTG